MCVCVYLAFEDELEGKGALAGEVGVALRVVDAGFQHPRLVEDGEARRFIVETRDEVVSAVWPELDLWTNKAEEVRKETHAPTLTRRNQTRLRETVSLVSSWSCS